MPGVPDPLYVRARAALLEAVDALGPQCGAVVLVGAQAVYLHTGDADLAVAEYTTDADFAVSPADLADGPLLGDLFTAHGFVPREHPGGWLSPDGIYVDIMVPEALAGPGTRGARLGPHGKRAARRAKGLEGALVDHEVRTITTLDPLDARTATLRVAGPGALLVAKLHKIAERTQAHDACGTRTRWTSFVSCERPRPTTLPPASPCSAALICRLVSRLRRSSSFQPCSADKTARAWRWPCTPPVGPRTERRSPVRSWHL
jgi:hypothetical protein